MFSNYNQHFPPIARPLVSAKWLAAMVLSVVLFVAVVALVAEVVPSVIKKVDIDWVAPAVAVAGSIVTLLIMLC